MKDISKWISDKISELENEKSECLMDIVKPPLDNDDIKPLFANIERYTELYKRKIDFLDICIERVKGLSNEVEVFNYRKDYYIFNEIWNRDGYKLIDAEMKESGILDDGDEIDGDEMIPGGGINFLDFVTAVGTDQKLLALTDDEFAEILYEESYEYDEEIEVMKNGICEKFGLSEYELNSFLDSFKTGELENMTLNETKEKMSEILNKKIIKE